MKDETKNIIAKFILAFFLIILGVGLVYLSTLCFTWCGFLDKIDSTNFTLMQLTTYRFKFFGSFMCGMFSASIVVGLLGTALTSLIGKDQS
jgi:hypothetical protein